jgi:hypothetical protein
VGRDVAADVREQARQAAAEAREQARVAKEEARQQARQAREQARQPREAREAREPREAREQHEPREAREQHEPREQHEDGPEAARRVHEQAERLREEARRARDESLGSAGSGERLGEHAGAWFHSGEQDWTRGPGWTDWPGRRGWEDWARTRSRTHGPGWTGPLDFGTLRDLERLAVQFTSDLRRLAVQSSAAGENVISDLRAILEEALDRIKSEIFGAGSEGPADKPAGEAGDSAKQD